LAEIEYIQNLVSYVPTVLARRLVDHPEPLEAPFAERFQAAVLFADITGFTALTEQLASQGPDGAEAISRILNDYFSQLIETIHIYGGDVVKFAGDALLAIWKDAEPNELALHAASCALTIQQKLHNYSPAEGVSLTLRIGLGQGELAAAHVGGMMRRWEFVITGDPVTQASLSELKAEPGQVVVSNEIQVHLANIARVERDVLVSLDAPTPLTSPRFEPQNGGNEGGGGQGSQFDLSALGAAVDALRTYIPGAILNRLAAGQASWMAELRRVTVLFINLPEFGQAATVAPAPDVQAGRLFGAQMVMRTLQETIYRYEGSVNKISVDEKGVTLLAAFGLPPVAHEDDGARGVLAAMEVVERMKTLGLGCHVGITSGRVFCGAIGNATRREYTIVGQVVNLAARLVATAIRMKRDDVSILCDKSTWEAARVRVGFETLEPVSVKGIEQPVAIFRPLQRLNTSNRSVSRFVGRLPERAMLAEGFESLRSGQGSVVIIEGEAGIGKSRLVEDLLQNATRENLMLLVGAGDSIEKSASYHAWRPVFRQLFNLENVMDGMEAGHQGMVALTVAQSEAVLAEFRARLPDMVQWAPLLSSVLPIDVPDNELTQHIRGEARALDTQRLLVALLEQAANAAPLLLVIEDAHWLDSASWALVRSVAEQLPQVYLLVATRPLGEVPPPDYTRLLEITTTRVLKLQPLPMEDAFALVCQRLGTRTLPQPVRDLIAEKAEGHPFFSEELAYALRDSGLLRIENGESKLNASVEELNALIPNTIEGVITSRIDRLTSQQQLTLKVASVIGRVFAMRVLHDIHPIDTDRPLLQEHLQRLEQLDLTPLDTPAPDTSYIFKHIITQEVAYNLMLFTQRQQLHRTVAEWYETTYAEDLSPYYPLLAHHYSQAEDKNKTIEYMVKSAEQALLQFANQEAISFMTETLKLAGEEPLHTPEARLQRAKWELMLGQAYLGLGNLPKTKEHLYISLELLGRPMPSTRLQTVVVLLKQLGQQILRLLFPRLIVGPGGRNAPAPEENERLLGAFHVHEHLFEIFYFASDRIHIIASALQMLNLAERIAPFPGRSSALIGMSLIAGVAGVKGLSTRYRERAIIDARDYGSLPEQNWVKLIDNLTKLGEGTSPEIQQAFVELEEFYDKLGNRRRFGEARVLHALSYYYQGNYQRNLELAAEFSRRLQRTNEMQQKVWGLQAQSRSLVVMGRNAEATILLEQAKAFLEQSIDQASEMIVTGLSARAYWQAGDPAKARLNAERGAWIILNASPTNFSAQIGYDGVANVLVSSLEMESQAGKPLDKNLLDLAQKVIKTSRRFSRSFPINLASTCRWEGILFWLAGKHAAARKSWQKGLASAIACRHDYDVALLCYELGRHAPDGPSMSLRASPERAEYLQRAKTIFERIGAVYNLEQLNKLTMDRNL
jgi:class 3 adenylate cyclase